MRAPRELVLRVAEQLPSSLSDLELVAATLDVGLDVAQQLFARFGTLSQVSRATLDELADILGARRASWLIAGLELGRRTLRPEQKPRLRYASEVHAYFAPRIGALANEVFHVACLDVRNQLLRNALVATGGFASCALLPREVFAPAMGAKAVGVVLVHNHPSGSTEPSQDDLTLTRRLVQAGQVLGIRVLDHVVVSQGSYHSMAEHGQMG